MMVASNRLNAERDTCVLNNQYQMKLLEALSENEKKLAESEKIQLRSLMGNVAHDLKTPLHSIKADLEVLNLLMSKIPKSAIDKAVALLQSSFFQQTFEFQSLFNMMDATCKFMMMSINRSQDFMKASNNICLLPILNTFDLHAAVEISVTCIKHIELDRLIIVHPLDDKICSYLVSDEHWVMENLLCLLSNAMKYSNNGHVDVHMKVIDAPLNDPSRCKSTSSSLTEGEEPRKNELTIIKGSDTFRRLSKTTDKARRDSAKDTTKRMILITVEDSGIGISEQARKDLFQPFKQAQRMAGGTGLGLFSLLKRVEALNGEVGVTSRTDLNQGSMFWFTFPYRPDEEAAALLIPDILDADENGPRVNAKVKERSGSDPMPLKPSKILLIDDSQSVLRVTSRFLSMNGHTVVTALNGCTGLELLKEAYDAQLVDMVITDMQMPVMDGIEAMSRYRVFETEQIMKGDGSRKPLVIVGMSANSDNQTKQEAINAGMNFFITKPFAYRDLTAVLSYPSSPRASPRASLTKVNRSSSVELS
eukprot:CAMPEP_0119037016 /NCGR_PEP_ID=MMETSP1177-20130426/5105_1 /TAXON_ID=2985 /ORGANISM="Ochromonas sp, Strain CCMP1899" /LENGTH=533 /DNA_ID=CAMNT_0006997681 /DNA_START=1096 /DNA_END=2697 /DNA_ORIENTATION=-